MPEPKNRFTPESRAEGVRLTQTSGRSRRAVATDCGVGLSTLRHWIDGGREREMNHLGDEQSHLRGLAGSTAFVAITELW